VPVRLRWHRIGVELQHNALDRANVHLFAPRETEWKIRDAP
jgi:hypothetical protein